MNSENAPAGFPGGFCTVMAVYERDDPRLFARAIKSVLDNTLKPDQFILVVDGPVPTAIEETIHSYADRGLIEVLHLAENVGLASALNAAIEQVRYDWIARADADDFNVKRRFERQAAAAIANPDINVIGSALREVDLEGRLIAVRRVPLKHSDIRKQLPWRCPLNHPTVAFRTALAKRVGGYPKTIHMKEDYAMWCLFAIADARFLNIDEPLVLATAGIEMYRRRGGMRYVRSEFAMQRFMVSLHLKSVSAASLHGFARAAVFAMPAWVRGILYRRLLRSSK